MVYAWTAAPNVTLLDSGEFLVAAQHFGVPHPTGYPLWTFLAWLWTLLPLGNAAWEVNLFSGILGSLAVGVSALLSCSALRWIQPDIVARWSWAAHIAALSAAALFAFSFSMWSQAVIAEVYTLHTLLCALFLCFLYLWIRRPNRDSLLFLAFFFLTLAFSNHQLVLAYAPLPFLAVFLVRRNNFADLLTAGLLTTCGVYFLFGAYSNDPLVWKTAIRFGYFTAAILVIYFSVRRLRGIKFILLIPLAVVLGLLPYAYLPFASSTNPPMNWGYTREPEGLFKTFNRSQYSGPLTDQSLRVIGRLMGVPTRQDFEPRPTTPGAPAKPGLYETLTTWASFFGTQLTRSFTLLGLAAYALSLTLFLSWRRPDRFAWAAVLHVGFLSAAFLQPLLDPLPLDIGGWWLQMPFHTFTNLLFSLLVAAGFFQIFALLFSRFPLTRIAYFLLLALPIVPLVRNFSECSQRDHWFGWMFGYDMLKDLPRGSVLIGGSDPGRFVPTYMIFGESSQESRFKRESAFDRRDLFIITQNALGEPGYMKYLRDQYTRARPPVSSSFEQWLGRASTYPEETLALPSSAEIETITKLASLPDPATGRPLESNRAIVPFSATLYWIWLRNRDWRDFFVEESFPILWTYDYAIPSGLVYKLNPTRLDRLPPNAVRGDFAFWDTYKQKLLADPLFATDLDARRSFSRLRTTGGNIYRHHKMTGEAERAYRQALELWPDEPLAINSLTQILWQRDQFTAAQELTAAALQRDPRNVAFQKLAQLAAQRRENQARIDTFLAQLKAHPSDRGTLQALIMLLSSVGEREKASELLLQGYNRFGRDPDFLRFAAAHDVINGQPINSLTPALHLAEIEPENPANQMILAQAWYYNTNLPSFFSAMEKAIQIGGPAYREMFLTDPSLAPVRKHEDFQRITREHDSNTSILPQR